MPSSTSSSEPRGVLAHEGALPAGLRLTASDRPGQAQPVPTRDIPEQPWGRLAIAVAATLLIGTALIEWNARRIGLNPGDLDNSQTDWAAERARSAGAAVAIVGDSRILFDTDLDRFEALTGVRPIQLAIHGTSGLTLLQDAAANPDFKGLLIVGIAETMFFQPFDGYGGYVKKIEEFTSPAKRASARIDHVLQRRLAFLDNNYRFSVIAARLDPNLRPGVEGPYDDVWKMMEVGEHRQTHLWPRIATDPKVRTHARYAWKGFKEKFPYTPKLIATGLDKAAKAVETIRARGGEVVFVRPPSDIHLRINEQAQLPKAKSWDALLRVTKAAGVHNDDLPPHLRRLIMPEWSHLDRACATVFTDAYVRRLAALTPRLVVKADAPPPLSRDDCVRPGQI